MTLSYLCASIRSDARRSPDLLDTGLRISHDDFGGRALAGWSAYCNELKTSECAENGGSWLRRGVIAGSTVCNGHGTHCGSTAAGTTYGVAKNATLIAVQAIVDIQRVAGIKKPHH